jgi:hypothetical protein
MRKNLRDTAPLTRRNALQHLSTEGTRVVNYAQWRSAEALRVMQQNPTARQHMARCADLADGFEPHLYTVKSVHSAP